MVQFWWGEGDSYADYTDFHRLHGCLIKSGLLVDFFQRFKLIAWGFNSMRMANQAGILDYWVGSQLITDPRMNSEAIGRFFSAI
jgi:hypothetical protein